MYLQNSQICQILPNFALFWQNLRDSKGFRGGRTDGGGRTHTLFKFEALLHKKPLRGNKHVLSPKNITKIQNYCEICSEVQKSFVKRNQEVFFFVKKKVIPLTMHLNIKLENCEKSGNTGFRTGNQQTVGT